MRIRFGPGGRLKRRGSRWTSSAVVADRALMIVVPAPAVVVLALLARRLVGQVLAPDRPIPPPSERGGRARRRRASEGSR